MGQGICRYTVCYRLCTVTVYAGKANGTVQVCKGQNGTMAINLNGSKISSSLPCCEFHYVYDVFSRISIAGQFKMYEAVMDPDDLGHSYDVICLESCAHPGSYIYWNQQSVEIYVR